jgi:GntR family transcriptional regulator
MILNLTDISDEPLQSQISRQIRAKILAGELSDGDSLPSIRGFAKDHRVSVITVQRAYDNLFREGLIHSRRGKGFFVSRLTDNTRKNMAKQRLAENLKSPFSAALAEGLTVDDIQDIVSFILNQNGK